MKTRVILVGAILTLALAGCASNQGGTGTVTNVRYGSDRQMGTGMESNTFDPSVMSPPREWWPEIP
ncbi:MAG: hypothetical protein ACTHKU_05550 [Verrucomicrobiota bacterium]